MRFKRGVSRDIAYTHSRIGQPMRPAGAATTGGPRRKIRMGPPRRKETPAYYPQQQQDIAQFQQFRKDIPFGSPPLDSRVVTTFAARPINAEDFIVVGGTIGGLLTATYTVAPGLVAIIDRLTVYYRPTSCNGPASMDIYGYTNCPAGLMITVEDAAVRGFSGILIPWILEDFPVYILAAANQTINISVGAFGGGTGVNQGTLTAHGTLLVQSGRPLTHEPGVSTPEPVHIKNWPEPILVKPYVEKAAEAPKVG